MAALPHDINPVCGGVRHASLLPIYSHGTAQRGSLFRGKVLLGHGGQDYA